jgi:ABC-type transporter MlaC component
VATQLIYPGKSGPPLEVSFRVRTDGPRPVVTDVSVEGVWLSLQQRDQFVSFLGQNNGNVKLLLSHLSELAKQFKS